ncbi:uncharacterized protein QC764_709730 [Podospora pseudoanserina]|uniref:Uncharacterized protein n=1 Tax=Podospora pseudoanserina TaxID=2609844 RepID=A0ABR0HKU7_9PEZI|nr:hypothetical protein QC764_709730 [Podospora pseudoanserina]
MLHYPTYWAAKNINVLLVQKGLSSCKREIKSPMDGTGGQGSNLNLNLPGKEKKKKKVQKRNGRPRNRTGVSSESYVMFVSQTNHNEAS